jgi:hypothetical protein
VLIIAATGTPLRRTKAMWDAVQGGGAPVEMAKLWLYVR